MQASELLRIERAIDHTLLRPDCTKNEIDALHHAALPSEVASICIPPSYVAYVAAKSEHKPICTVIGFPNGYATARTKVAEAAEAVANGAAEIDMVINLGHIKNGDDAALLAEVQGVRAATQGAILKVILETGALTKEDIRRAVIVLNAATPDFFKTSTGFGFPGASVEAVSIIRENKAPSIGIKASGGIRTLDDACRYLEAGATRLGASSLLTAVQQAKEVYRRG